MIFKKITRQSTEAEGPEINLSPLIDCVFILLIFYIVTTVFVEESGVEVDKPDAAAAQQLDKNSLQIAITDRNEIFYGGSEIGVEGVSAIVRRQFADQKVPVIIQADRGADHGIFAEVFGAAKAAGAEQISFATLE